MTCVLTGAAGFVGSHLADRLLESGCRVIGVDNLRLGRIANLEVARRHADFTFLESDVNDYAGNLAKWRALHAETPIDMVWHLAANSDIRAGGADPGVDLTYTFLTTFHVLKLMRELGIRRLAFASTSAIYGAREGAVREDDGPWQPISNYGAMKLASEACISAAIETHLEQAWIFRFPNVVGPRATHGVIYDFMSRLRDEPRALQVLGDGRQEKPYLHVAELVEAMLFIRKSAGARLNCFNIGPESTATTVERIARQVVRRCAPGAAIHYTGGAQGWPGDVPKFQYSTERLRELGWRPRLTSDAAVDRAIEELAVAAGFPPIA